MKVNLKTFLILLFLTPVLFGEEDAIVRAEKLLKQGSSEQFKIHITKYLADHDSAEAYEKVGTLFARNKKWDEAIHYLEIAVNRDQKNPQLWYKLGISYHQGERVDDSIVTFRKAIALNPKNIPYILTLGEVLENADDRYDASQLYLETNKKVKKNLEILKKICLLNFQDAYWKETVKSCQEVVDMDSRDEMSWTFYAMANFELQLREKAFSSFKKAIGFNPSSPILHRARGLLFYQEKSYEQALIDLGYAAAQDPTDEEAMLYLARTLFEMERYDEARIAYKEVCLLNRSNRFEFLSKQRTLEKLHKDELAAQYQENLDKL